MALGDQYNNNKPQYKEIEVYSAYGMTNAEGVVDPSALSISFFRQLMKIAIAPKQQTADGSIKWDNENAAIVYLTHIKARILYEGIKNVLDPNKPEIHNAGVNSGSGETVGLITFSDGKSEGLSGPCLIIRKIDQAGRPVSTYMYEFKQQYHSAIINFDGNTSKFDHMYFDNLEIKQFMDALKEYYTAMTHANAYSVMYQQRFDMSRIHTKLNAIADKVGASPENTKGSYNGGGNSFFNNRSANSTSHSATSSATRQATLDDLESELE